MAWRVARSLLTLRDQINARYPNRNRASDGTIGDADHQNRNSDHNPWYGPGIVTAMDITHDPANGVDIDRITDDLAASRDRRIKYVIANRLIMSGAGGPSPWVWRNYSGPNPHTRHFHLSVVASPLCDDTTPWNLPSLRSGGGGAAPGQEDDMTPDEHHMLEWMYKTLGNTPDKGARSIGDFRQYMQDMLREVLDGTRAAKAERAALASAVEALSQDDGLTRDEVEAILRDAVAQHIQITGEVHIGPTGEGN